MELFADFLARELASDAALDLHRYLIVDTAATRPTNMAKALAIEAPAFDLLKGERCDWRESASPVLLELPRQAQGKSTCSSIRNALIKWRYANCFIAIVSDISFQQMTQLLSQRTDALLPDNMTVVLRYFDTRVFGTLMQIFSNEQRREFLSAATHWTMPGRWGELQSYKGDTAHEIANATLGIRLNALQEAALIESGDADALVDLMLNQGHPALSALVPPEQYEKINLALAKAKKTQINEISEQVAYCTVALELGTDFGDEPAWAPRMTLVKSGKLKFTDVLRTVMQEEER
jgi:Domain of unknown function (DUF4123)